VRRDLLTNLPDAVTRCTEGWDHSTDDWDPEGAIQPLRSLAHHLPELYPDDATVKDTAARLDRLLDEWVVDHSSHGTEDDDSDKSSFRDAPVASVTTGASARSVFEDLLDGRADVPRSHPAGSSQSPGP
jgi:hypothetical protein